MRRAARRRRARSAGRGIRSCLVMPRVRAGGASGCAQLSARLVRTRPVRQHARRMVEPSNDEQRWSAWMALAQRGDREAYAKLMAELADVIESFVRARFGGPRASDFVEDCVQEALLALHRVRHTFDPRRPFRPWMFAVVRHKVIDLLRRSEVRRSE